MALRISSHHRCGDIDMKNNGVTWLSSLWQFFWTFIAANLKHLRVLLSVSIDLGTKRQWQNVIAQKPQWEKSSPQTPTQKNQRYKSVTFYTLSFCPWHADRTPFPSHHNNDITYEIIVYGAIERSRTKAGQLPNTSSHFGCSTRKSKQNLSAHPFQIQLYLN